MVLAECDTLKKARCLKSKTTWLLNLDKMTCDANHAPHPLSTTALFEIHFKNKTQLLFLDILNNVLCYMGYHIILLAMQFIFTDCSIFGFSFFKKKKKL